MLERAMAENNKILKIKTGSHLYGLNTPQSDLDYAGIFLPSIEYVLGLNKVEEVDLSVKSKHANGKNDKDAIDFKLYEFRKYINLALQNNPNILEMLFVDSSNIEFINDYGKELLNLKQSFIHKGLKERFIGYSISQKKKMVIKRDNYFELEEGIKILDKLIENGDDKLLLPQCGNCENFSKVFKLGYNTDNHYKIGERNIVKNQTVKRAKQELEQILAFSTNRKDLIKTTGYDHKFGMNLIRLLLEGKELLETGDLIFPLVEHDLLMDIKLGKWTLDDVLEYSEYLENEINNILKTTSIPTKPDTQKIEKFTMEVLKEWILK